VDIDIDDQAGLLRVIDPRLIKPSRRRYLRKLIDAVCDQPGVRRVEFDLTSSTCRIDFDLTASSPAVMAGVIVSAVRNVPHRGFGLPRLGLGPKWATLTAYRTAGVVSVWETHENGSERCFVRDEGPTGGPGRRELAADLSTMEAGAVFHVARWARRLTVTTRESPALGTSMTLDRLERLLESGFGPTSPPAIALMNRVDGSPVVATGWMRWRYLAMAGGSFALTLIGLVVPGIPTVPFLLATSYYLARSSPELDARLRETVFFGPILREWETHGGLTGFSKGKLVALTLAIVVATVILAPLSAIGLVGIFIVSAASVYGLYRIPDAAIATGQSQSALPSPATEPIA
jgi:uncharacterized membrane protein YbaN (DUF454 family)